MAVSINSALSSYAYMYKGQVRGTFDSNSDAAWDRAELSKYAEAYKSATGKTLDVDKLIETYGDENGKIDYAAQEQMYQDDVLGFSNITSASSSSSASGTDGDEPAISGKAITSATTESQKVALYNLINNFTYSYNGEFKPELDSDSDGMWSRDELQTYADAYEKATGQSINVDTLLEEYGTEFVNENGDAEMHIDPTGQGRMMDDDALGLSKLASIYNQTKTESAENYYVRNTIMDYDGSDYDYTGSHGGESSSGGMSMEDMLSSMSSSGKMFFSTKLQGLESTQSMMDGMFGASGGSSAGMFSLANARTDAMNSYKLQEAQGSDYDSLTNGMSGMAMNFTI